MKFFINIKNKIHRKILIFKLKRLSKSINYKIIAASTIGILIIAITAFAAIKASSSIINTGINIVVSVAGEDMQEDLNGNTNFLLTGTGGKNHEGSNLTDSILIASLNNETKQIIMLSIPRDLYVKDSPLGSYKINEAYFRGKKQAPTKEKEVEFGIKNLESNIEDMLGIEIHYWAKINFEGLVDLVDILGGIDIYVDKSIYDPTYPKDGTFEFEPFRINKGDQHLDGATALKYARSRHTTSDFDRAKRQQKILSALKDKAISTDIIFSKSKIKDILDSLDENIKTNMNINEMITLAGTIKDINRDNIINKVLHDDPQFCGGLLYTPDRSLYNNMFILRPMGGKDFLHTYTNLLFKHSDAINNQKKLQVLNGTSQPGVAGTTSAILERFCFNTNYPRNGKDKLQKFTTYYYKAEKDENNKQITPEPPVIKALQTLIPGKVSTNIPPEYKEYFTGSPNRPNIKSDIILEIGTDYTQSENYMIDPYYNLPDVKAWVPDTTDNDTGDITNNDVNSKGQVE